MIVTAQELDLPCDSPVTDQEGMISGFRREVAENCALLGYYAACSGNLLPGTVRKYHYALRNNPEEYSSPCRGNVLNYSRNLKKEEMPPPLFLEAKLRIHSVIAKGTLKFGGDVCVLNDIERSIL